MESLLNRYRNITVLLLVIMAQLVLLAVDSKTQGVPLIRVWAVTAVTPVARVLEGLRGGGSGFSTTTSSCTIRTGDIALSKPKPAAFRRKNTPSRTNLIP